MLRLDRRADLDWLWTLGCFSVAVLASLAVGALLLASAGAEVGAAFEALLKGSVGSGRAILSSLGNATPLLLTGLATVIAFRARVWSIGQEGQVFMGAISAYWASLLVASWPAAAGIPVILAAGAIGGLVLGALSGWLSVRLGVNVIISTVMLNYCVIYLLSYLLQGGPWGEVGETISYQQTAPVPANLQLPYLFGSTKVHVGLLIGLAAAVLAHALLSRTALGFEIRAHGFNPVALRFRGTNVSRVVLVVMAISGALAGLAGAGEVFGVTHRLRADSLYNIGYTGIIVGMIGGLTPAGAVLAALFFGGLASGALYMKVLVGVPSALVFAIEGIVLLFFLCAGVASQYRLVKVAVHERTA
jgi:ABC-type uncharacterized transport system permease subunit